MSKQITITDPISEQVYTLEYNRKSILRAIEAGFDPYKMAEGDVESVLMIPVMFNCAFDMHHGIKPEEETDAIYNMIGDKQGLIGALADAFTAPINALTEDPKGAKSKNFKWKKTW